MITNAIVHRVPLINMYRACSLDRTWFKYCSASDCRESTPGNMRDTHDNSIDNGQQNINLQHQNAIFRIAYYIQLAVSDTATEAFNS